ncbi:metallophosphoesterase [Kaistia dalseonensis]|uniref:Phosphodiesterase n=1 Tax=Kaistia dalseonensis TaxID=410840 RepID=A0ABU0H4W4_9HYPH|nr:metallophosphoesterase [Kaistia dalseonensis]MCX5494767.1 metallophosphoesterase [Kaistia dalseonensis]MDQ0437348.1 putative phosphodiesterase [Kaistia dalseonensis]
MKCLIVADLHYSLAQYDWVLSMAERFDAVIIAGDHLDISSAVDWRAQTIVIRKYLDLIAARTRLITCSGNHDLDSRDASGEKVARWVRDFSRQGIPSDDTSFVMEDVLFTICPWWDGPNARARVAAQLAADALKPKTRWFWLHHAPPDKSPTSWTGQRYFGDVELAEWIAQYSPDIVFSGHVHQSPFARDGSWVDRINTTWVFNAGHTFGAPPPHIVLDTVNNEAVWLSAAGVQAVRLDQPLERPVPQLTTLPAWLTSPDRVGDQSPA